MKTTMDNRTAHHFGLEVEVLRPPEAAALGEEIYDE